MPWCPTRRAGTAATTRRRSLARYTTRVPSGEIANEDIGLPPMLIAWSTGSTTDSRCVTGARGRVRTPHDPRAHRGAAERAESGPGEARTPARPRFLVGVERGALPGLRRQPLEGERQVAGGLKPRARVFLQTPCDDARQARRDVPIGGDVCRLFFEDGRHHVDAGLARERAPAAQQLSSTAPSAKRSARRSAGCPRTCSGDM